MNISSELKKYLNESRQNLESNILCTDLNNILLCTTDIDDNYFSNKEISNELLSIINSWKDVLFKEQLIMIYNLCCIPLVKNDKTHYYSQMILPICHYDKLDGLLIFFRKDRNYIPSSAKPALTTKDFVEKLTDNNFYKNYSKT